LKALHIAVVSVQASISTTCHKTASHHNQEFFKDRRWSQFFSTGPIRNWRNSRRIQVSYLQGDRRCGDRRRWRRWRRVSM